MTKVLYAILLVLLIHFFPSAERIYDGISIIIALIIATYGLIKDHGK